MTVQNPDIRFAILEDAAALVMMMPRPELIEWPSELGDIEAIDAAWKVLDGLPEIKRSWKCHKRELRGLRAVGG